MFVVSEAEVEEVRSAMKVGGMDGATAVIAKLWPGIAATAAPGLVIQLLAMPSAPTTLVTKQPPATEPPVKRRGSKRR